MSTLKQVVLRGIAVTSLTLCPIFAHAEALQVSVWTFSGDNTWTPTEWRQMFRTVQEFYKERLGVRLKVISWRNNRKLHLCAKQFRYKTEKAFGNCLIRKAVKPHGSKVGFNLLLTPPIPIGGGNTGVGGLSTGVCQIDTGTAMVHGKRVSTHYFDDGGNAGWEMTRLAVMHEIGHVAFGMTHTDLAWHVKSAIDVMNSDALFLLTEEFQIKVQNVWENFRDALPLSHYSKWEAKQCLNNN